MTSNKASTCLLEAARPKDARVPVPSPVLDQHLESIFSDLASKFGIILDLIVIPAKAASTIFKVFLYHGERHTECSMRASEMHIRSLVLEAVAPAM